MSELISVIIPVYKVEPYLNKCVDSVLAQTYPNLEVILINDGSPDGCGDICDAYAGADPRVKVIHQENAGVSSARNAGIDQAGGDLLAFLDSDDWVHERYLEILHELSCRYDADMAVCGFVMAYSEEAELDIGSQEAAFYEDREIVNLLMKGHHLNLVLPAAKIFRKHMFDEIRYPVGKVHEDEFVVHLLLHEAKKLVITPKQLYYYRQRAGSFMTTRHNLNQRMDALEALGKRAEFLRDIGQIQLRDQTLKKQFGIYLATKRIIKDEDDPLDRALFIKNFSALRDQLRTGNYALKFKVFYELYYILPGLMDLIQRINERLHR